MIIAADRRARNASVEDTIVVRTPLDAIVRLEGRNRISTIVLAGSFATNRELASFLCEAYPSVRVEREG